jgi:hypothetical protein
MRRARHQKGSLQRVKRKSGESVWIFRWYEVQLDGTKCYRKAVLGSVSEYKTEAEAQKAADALRLEINEQTPRQMLQAISIETLVEHYRQHELPDIVQATRPLGSVAGEDETRKSYSTQLTYAGYLRKWILPRWRSYRLTYVKPIHVEEWLKSLPMSRGSKAKIRNIMSALYSHAQRWEWTTSNPITHVRQSAKRSRIPTVLTIDQLRIFWRTSRTRPRPQCFWEQSLVCALANYSASSGPTSISRNLKSVSAAMWSSKESSDARQRHRESRFRWTRKLRRRYGHGGCAAPITSRTIGFLPVPIARASNRTGRVRFTVCT